MYSVAPENHTGIASDIDHGHTRVFRQNGANSFRGRAAGQVRLAHNESGADRAFDLDERDNRHIATCAYQGGDTRDDPNDNLGHFDKDGDGDNNINVDLDWQHKPPSRTLKVILKRYCGSPNTYYLTHSDLLVL